MPADLLKACDINPCPTQRTQCNELEAQTPTGKKKRAYYDGGTASDDDDLGSDVKVPSGYCSQFQDVELLTSNIGQNRQERTGTAEAHKVWGEDRNNPVFQNLNQSL